MISLSTAALVLPASAAQTLRVERSDGSEITMRPCVIGWGMDGTASTQGGYFVHTVESGGAADATRLESGDHSIAAVYADGTAQRWTAINVWNYTSTPGTPTLTPLPVTDVKSVVITSGNYFGVKNDGSIETIPSSGHLGPPPAGFAPVTEAASARWHGIAVRNDGTVATWTREQNPPGDDQGQATVPAGLSGVVDVVAGDLYSVALKSDGTVRAWGAAPQRNVPAGLAAVKQIATGQSTILALTEPGNIVAWGQNASSLQAGSPVAKYIALGDSGAVAATVDGRVAVWGSGTSELQPPPGLAEVTQVAAAEKHFAALTTRRVERFGNVGKGSRTTRTFTIRNSGDQPLAISSVALTGIQGNAFDLDRSALPASLGAGESGTITIGFAPTAVAPAASLLTVQTNDPARPEMRFSVSGYGVNEAPVANDSSVQIPEDSVDFEITLPGTDPNSDALTFELDGFYSEHIGIFGPLNGNKVRFTPAKDFNGSFPIQYDIYDGPYAQPGTLYDRDNVLTITVTPVNDPPILTVPPVPVVVRASAAGAGAAVSFDVGAGDLEDGFLQPVLRVGGQVVHSGDVFPPGETTVEASITDANGVTTTRSFVVRVVEGAWLAVKDEAGRAIQKSGQVIAWGSNPMGETTVPADLVDAIAISAGYHHSLALRENGQVVAWGMNDFGQGGVPAGLQDVVSISTNGSASNLALKRNGTVAVWGQNAGSSLAVPAGLNNAVGIATSGQHVVALRQDGSVVAWPGTAPGAAVPAGLPPLNLIAAGQEESFGRTASGQIVRWGGASPEPIPFPQWLAGVREISSQDEHTLALRHDGTVVAWGRGYSNESKVPVGLDDAVSVGAGEWYSVAARRTGSVVSWGNAAPAQPAGITGVDAVAAGRAHVLAIKDRKERVAFRMPVTFGAVSRTLTLQNSGSSALSLGEITVSGAHAGDFSLQLGGLPGTLTPGQSVDLPVSFLPTGLGVREAVLRISTNDALQPLRELTLSGFWANSAPVVLAVNGLTMTEDQPGGLAIPLPSLDANGQALSFKVVNPPPAAAGTVTISGNVATFVPALDFNGSTSFTYRANDGFDDSNTATVSITLSSVADSPRLSIPTAPWTVSTVPGGTGANVEFPAGAMDPEDGWLTATITRNGVPVRSGDFFPLGDTVVDITAMDSSARMTTGSFIVRVIPGPEMSLATAPPVTLPKTDTVAAWGQNTYQQLAIPPDLADPVKLATGGFHVLALRQNGTVAAWGRSSSGEINVPSDLSGVVDISAGYTHSVALKSDGTLAVWGSNGASSLTPPVNATNLIAIASGGNFIAAVRQDGTALVWGTNVAGENNVPAGLAGVVDIAAGYSHVLALKANGTVTAWGENSSGKATVPAGLKGVIAVAAGLQHSLALRQDGTLVAWGDNSYGQSAIPAGLQAAKVKAIAAGNLHSMALTHTGEVWVWGSNSDGQALMPATMGRAKAIAAGGYLSTAITDAPVPLDFGPVMQGSTASIPVTVRNGGPGTLEIGDISFLGAAAGEFTVDTTGMDTSLAASESTTFIVRFAPVQNGARSATLRIASNDALHPQSRLILNGHAYNGSPVAAVHPGAATAEDTPVTITLAATDPENDPLVYTVRSITPPNAGTLGNVSGNQVVFTPAHNFNGSASFLFEASDGGTLSNAGTVQVTVTPVNDPPTLGYAPGTIRVFSPLSGGAPVYFRPPQVNDVEDGLRPVSMSRSGTPVQSGSVFPIGTSTVSFTASDTAGATLNGSFQVQVVATAGPALEFDSPALRSPAVVQWNKTGQLSDPPLDLRGVKQISAGLDHGYALRNDGTLAGWGASSLGQLAVPATLTGVTQVACGGDHTLALLSNGTVVAWGSNSRGQSTVPTGLSGVIQVAAGENFSVALKSDGTVTAWGDNTYNQRTVPVGLSNVKAIATGGNHVLALKNDDTITGWGNSIYGQVFIPSNLGPVTAIAAGLNHSVALKADGTVRVWGLGSAGQTILPTGLSAVEAISAGRFHTLARKDGGGLANWGSFGSGALINANAPGIPAAATPASLIAAGGNWASVAIANPYSLGFGKVAEDSSSTRTFTIRNAGTNTLQITSITPLSGAAFSINTAGMASSLASGQTTSFSITFSPSTRGSFTGGFRISSNDRYENTIDLRLSGESVRPFEAWSTAAGLSGQEGSTDARPFDDDVLNMVKFAFNMNGAGPDHRTMVPGTGTSGLPHISVEHAVEGQFLRIEYLRRKNAGVSYYPEYSTTLAGEFTAIETLPEITEIDANWERAIIRLPINVSPGSRGFARVRVTVDP